MFFFRSVALAETGHSQLENRPLGSPQGASTIQPIGTVQLPIGGRIVMSIRFSGMLLAVVTTAFVIALGPSALAQFNMPGIGGGGVTATDRMGGGGGGKGATGKTTTVKSSKSNTSDRMGGGGGKGTANKGRNLNTSRSN